MKLLNEKYYRELVAKFSENKNELDIPYTKFSCINTNFFEKALQEKINLFIQIPSSHFQKELLFSNLVYRLTSIQFLESDPAPTYEVGMTLKWMKYPKQKDFNLYDIKGGVYYLREIPKNKKKNNDLMTKKVKYNELRKCFVIIKKGTNKNRLKKLGTLFKHLYGVDFIPNTFKSKSIVICQKSIWNSLSRIEILNSNLQALIPSTYFTKSGAEQSTINIDPALYFVPDYKTAYNSILLKNEKIDNIVLFDCKHHQISRIIMDQKDFGYNIFGVTTQTVALDGVQVWRWLKEEIEMINSL